MLKEIQKRFDKKSTEELLTIWNENNRQQYSYEAFIAVENLLKLRDIEIEPQKSTDAQNNLLSQSSIRTIRKIKNVAGLMADAIRALGRYPKMIVPLIVVWLIYTPFLIASKFHIPWRNYDIIQQSIIVFSIITVLSITFSWSMFILLELIRQIEMNEEMSLTRAIGKSVTDTKTAFPIVIMWAVLWFIFAILEAIFRRKSKNTDEEYNTENVAKTVAGFEKMSLSAVFFKSLSKGVRMVVFLVYPAIAWEKLGILSSAKKGLGVAKSHKGEFLTGFFPTEFAVTIIFTPPAILFYISKKFDVCFSDQVWLCTIIYCVFAWSLSLFIEQMFVAELYLWHLIWEKEVKNAEKKGMPLPMLSDVKRPSIMDKVADLYLTNISFR